MSEPSSDGMRDGTSDGVSPATSDRVSDATGEAARDATRDERTAWTEMDSPAGPLRLAADAHGLREVHFADAGNTPPSGWERDDRALAPVVAQLREYLAGERCAFDVRLAPVGTPFDRLTWDALRDIPHGTTISYAELARRVGRPGAARAVGRANGRNPIAIIVPCHRVIAADGTLGGYAGGLHVKRLLLDLERRQGRIG